jgi:nitrilase
MSTTRMPDFHAAVAHINDAINSTGTGFTFDAAETAIQSAANAGNDIVILPGGVLSGNFDDNRFAIEKLANAGNIAIIVTLEKVRVLLPEPVLVAIDCHGDLVHEHAPSQFTLRLDKNMIQPVMTKVGLVNVGMLSAHESLQVHNHFLMGMGVELWCVMKTDDNTLLSEINLSHFAQTTNCYVAGFDNEGRGQGASFSGSTEVHGPFGSIKGQEHNGIASAHCALNSLRRRTLDWDPSHYQLRKEKEYFVARLGQSLRGDEPESPMPDFQVAAAQATPRFKKNGKFEIDMPATIAHTVDLITQAADAGNDIIVNPEVELGAYPRRLRGGTDVGARSEGGRDIFALYQSGAILLPNRKDRYRIDPIKHSEITAICNVAKEKNIAVVIGVLERSSRSQGTIYCTVLMIDSDGKICNKHRKSKDTAAERHIWGEGSAKTIKVRSVKTKSGSIRVAALPCWENLMPETAMLLKADGVQLWCVPTADGRPQCYNVNMPHLAKVMNCYMVNCNSHGSLREVFGDAPISEWDPEIVKELTNNSSNAILDPDEPMYLGGTSICGPSGHLPGGEPLLNRQGIISARCTSAQLHQRASTTNRLGIDMNQFADFMEQFDNGYDTGDSDSDFSHLITCRAALTGATQSSSSQDAATTEQPAAAKAYTA